MNNTGQRTAEFLAIVIENAELRTQLAETQDQCVELAVDAGDLHAEIEELKARSGRLAGRGRASPAHGLRSKGERPHLPLGCLRLAP
jgi:hypothetical protein